MAVVGEDWEEAVPPLLMHPKNALLPRQLCLTGKKANFIRQQLNR